MNRAGPSVREIKERANDRKFEVLRALGITAQPNRSGLVLISAPHRKDNNPSFAIWTHGGFVAWKDFATGEQGDILQLVDLVKGWTHIASGGVSKEGVRFLIDVLGIGNVSREQLARDNAAAKKRVAQDEKKAAEDLAKEQRRARNHWINAVAAFSIEPTRRYIEEARGLDFSKLPKGPRGGDRRPDILHALPAETHIWQGKPDDQRNGERSTWPCIVTPAVDFSAKDGKGFIRAIHRVFVRQDGTDKAPVKPPRKCWPAAAGCVLPLWRGDSFLPVAEANKHGLQETLVLTEGWEDGYSAVIAAPQFRTWAVISLSNLGNVPIPDCVDSIIVHRQNDWLKPQAVEAFERAKAQLEASGRPVSELVAFHGKDINDTLRG